MNSISSCELPDPVFKTWARDRDRFYCEICLKNCHRKNKKRMQIQSLDKDKFYPIALQWSKVDHHYNQILKGVDWNSDLFSCLPCKKIVFQLVPLWYEGSNLPTDEEYYEHNIMNLLTIL